MEEVRIRPFFLPLLLLALASCGGKGGTPPTTPIPPLQAIPEVSSTNGTASLTLQAAFDANKRPAFFWNGTRGAPTIRVQPGDTIHLHFVNSLPQFCAVGIVSNSNLHFHGLSSSPVAPADEVITTNAAPGSSVDYTVQINPDQPPGLYWYHPHPHGLSAWEIGNGMAGAIVVEGIASEVPETSGLRERVLVLTDIPNDPSVAAAEQVTQSSERRTKNLGGRACAMEVRGTPMINGSPLASIGIRPNEVQLFRVLNASNHRHFDLAISDGQLLKLVAQDGVPIHDYPGAPEFLSVPDILIPPGGRAEFLVTGSTQTTTLQSLCYETGSSFNPNPQVTLALLTNDTLSSSSIPQDVRVRPASALRRSRFYRVALPAPSVERTIQFQEDSNGVFSLNGAPYDPSAAPSITVQSGSVEEWTLENDTDEVHTFHLHQVHYVVESVQGVAQTNPHWVDSFNIPPRTFDSQGQPVPSTTKILIDFRDPTIRGTFVFHCHILEHEDAGMMAKIQVI